LGYQGRTIESVLSGIGRQQGIQAGRQDLSLRETGQDEDYQEQAAKSLFNWPKINVMRFGGYVMRGALLPKPASPCIETVRSCP